MLRSDLLDLSPDLVKIRPVYLTEIHIEQLAESWRSCCCCHELLEKEAVQVRCCDTIYHVHCLRSFAKHKALTLNAMGESPDNFFCPWCNITLNCRPRHVWGYLEASRVSTVLEAGKDLDKWLSYLSRLDRTARTEFMFLADDYEKLLGNPVGAMQLPAKVYDVRKRCESQPAALDAFEMLCEGEGSSFQALLEWESWLVCIGNLETQADLIDTETVYGHGPNRFVPRIVERLRKD